MTGPASPIKNIVLVGAGHAHVGVLRAFGLKPEPGIRLTLITRQLQTPYSGMLPGLIAGQYNFDDAHIDVVPLCQFANAQLFHGAAIGIDVETRHVLSDNRPPLPFDLLSINIGSTPNTRDVPGAEDNVIPVKPIDGFLERFEAARTRILANGAKAHIAVIGAGAGGTELVLSLERRLRRDARHAGFDPAKLRFAIVTQAAEILPAFPQAVRRRFTREMQRRGVEIVTNGNVGRVEHGELHFASGASRPFDEMFWTTAAAPAQWLAESHLALDAGGFIAVGPTLQSASHAGVFAAGDIAAVDGHDLPKAGVYAVRQGTPLAENLRRAARGEPLHPYIPQRNALSLISTGDRYAIGTRNGITFEGRWVWWLKDWIDRRFMAKFKALPRTLDPSNPLPPPPSRRANNPTASRSSEAVPSAVTPG